MKYATLVSAALVVTMLITIGNSTAQQQPEAQAKGKAQVSFVYPLGSNGIESPKKGNEFSLNILLGVNGPVDGLELGTLLNITKGNVDGLQAVGLANIITKDLKGGQLAGLANVSKMGAAGAQLAGFGNYAGGGTKLFQGAGFANISKGSLRGAQLAGFANLSITSTKGLQMAGFMNATFGKVEGLQFSLFMNIAKEVQGYQLGVFNFCDTISKGLPIGFLSFIRKGYHKFEVEYSTDIYAMINFKTGVEQFYNILSIVSTVERDELAYGFGYGLGGNIPLKNRSNLNIDLTAHQMSNGEEVMEAYNIVSKLKVNYSHRLLDHLSIYGGPAFVVRIQESATDKEGRPLEPVKVDNVMYEQTNDNNYISIYAALNFGLRF